MRTAMLSLGVALGLATSIVEAQETARRVKVFILAGQSNMEGAGRIEAQDKTVDERFQVLEAVDAPNLERKKGNWYSAVPPLCRARTGICPADYFGRTLVANLPKNIRIGVVNVSVAGCKIELFDNIRAVFVKKKMTPP